MDGKLIAGTLPAGYCVNDLQAFYNLMFAQGYVELDLTIPQIIVGTTEPPVDKRDYLWVRINPATKVFDRIYTYTNGAWVAPYRIPPNAAEHLVWFDTAAKLKLYDGGVDEPVGNDLHTGPFWIEDTAAAAKFLLGAGTLPSTKVIAVGDTGGAEKLTITAANLPNTKLKVNLPIIGGGGVNGGSGGPPVVGSDYGSTVVSGSGYAIDATATPEPSNRYKPLGETVDPLGTATPADVLPPYYGVIFAKRTARAYWVPA